MCFYLSPSLPPLPLSIPSSPSLRMSLPHMFEVHTRERVFLLSAPSEDEMQSWIGMLQTLKQYARHRSPTHPVDPLQNGSTASAILHQLAMENGATVSQGEGLWESSTLSMTTGTTQTKGEGSGGQSTTNSTPDPVLKRSTEKDEESKDEVSSEEPKNEGSNGTVRGRPRSQA